MKIIGLTGGIASGKSTVSQILIENNIPVIDADAVYKDLSRKGNRVWKAIYKEFGREFFLPDGELDRKALGAYIFSDNNAREKLNRVTHPIVKDEMLKALKRIEQEQNPPLIVLDVPLLYESNWDKWMDEVWVAAVPKKMQLERLMKRDVLTKEQALSRIDSQMSLDEKRKRAQAVIDNSGSIQETRLQVQKLLEASSTRGN